MNSILLLHSRDNIVLALRDLSEAQTVSLNGTSPATLCLQQHVPKMHKIALKPMAKGEAIYKYGQVIGFAANDIQAGEHVHTHNCVMGQIEKDYDFCRLATPTQMIPAHQRRTFLGYQRANGKVGTRNFIGILTSVNCSATVAKQIAQHFTNIKSHWPNIDGVVALTHTEGCGMRTGDEGHATLQRTFEGYLTHPNFGGLLLVGLGCETMQINQILQDAGLNNSVNVASFNIQDVGGTRQAIQKGIDLLEQLLPKVNEFQRSEISASEIVLAVQCGGSDAFSGVTANPALGIASDWIVRQGGTVIYSETPEIYGAEHLLTQRAETPDIAQKLVDRIHWWESYTQRNGFELDNNPSPGNKAGGLTTIVEKSLGAQAKGGSTNLREVCLYAEKPKNKGLVFMDSPGYDPVSVTGQVASGANIVCFTTGRGSAFGYKPVPSIKLCSNTETYQHMLDDMDINCGAVVDGEISLEEMGEHIFNTILAIASGQVSKSEELGYGDAEFNPWKIGAVM